MNIKILWIILFSFLNFSFCSCDSPAKEKAVQDNPIVKKHNAEYEDFRNQMKETYEKKNRFLREYELPTSVAFSYNNVWQRVMENDLLSFLKIDNTGEEKLKKRFKSFQNMLDNVNRRKTSFTPSDEQKARYSSLQSSLKPYLNGMSSWLAKNQNPKQPNLINLEIAIFELRKIARYPIDQFLSVSLVQEKYLSKYLDKKGEEFLMLVMNGILKK